MRFLDFYISLCRNFKKVKFPHLKLKEIDNTYKEIFKIKFDISKADIDKASFLILTLSIILIINFLYFIIRLNALFCLLFSFLISVFISYRFNIYLYKKFLNIGKQLSSYLYLIKIDFSLIQISKHPNEDMILQFIKLIINYNLPIKDDFKNILSRIHSGNNPEKELKRYLSPSVDFNEYLNNLIINNSKLYTNTDYGNTLEENFKIYLRELSTKISLIFFIGIFYPIGLCFFFIFIPFNKLLILFTLPFFFFILNYLFRNFIQIDHYFMGIIKINSIYERKKFYEFIDLIKRFSFYIDKNISPEKAFIITFFEKKNQNQILRSIISSDVFLFLNGSIIFEDLMNSIRKKFESYRYNIIFSSLVKMLKEDSKNTSKKIREILGVLNNHIKLGKKINTIIKGERIKVYLFCFLLPIILGTLGSLLSVLPFITNNLLNFQNINEITILDINIIYFDLCLFFIINSISTFISTYYFLATVSLKNKSYILIFVEILLILTFLISVFNVFPLICE